MRTPGRSLGVVLCGVVVALASGCVSKEEYERVVQAEKKCNEHREQLLQELQAEKDNVAALTNELAAVKDRLSGKDAEIARLQKENADLSAALDKLRETAEAAAQLDVPDPTVIVRKLPAELHKALQEFARKYPNIVEYDAKRGAVKWKSDLLFALGSDVVRNSAKKSLQEFAKIAASSAASKFNVIVVGHTDNLPIVKPETKRQHPTNWHLSAHRAISVNSLMIKYGVPNTRTGIMGYGEYQPIASNKTDKGRQQNRRVEIYLVEQKAIGVTMDGVTWLKDRSLAFARVK